MGFFDDWIKKTVVGWLAKQLGMDPAKLSVILTDIIDFLRGIFQSMPPAEQVAFIKAAAKAVNDANPSQVKALVKQIKEVAQK